MMMMMMMMRHLWLVRALVLNEYGYSVQTCFIADMCEAVKADV